MNTANDRIAVRSDDITFCATGKTGLGHLRRITNIARALRDRGPAYRLVLVTNAPVEGVTKEERALYRRIEILPRSEMAAYLTETNAGATVVDTAVLPGLSLVDAPLCLILRETTDRMLEMFRLEAGRHWNLVIVPNPRDEWLPDAGAIGAKRVEPVGWIYRRPSLLRSEKGPSSGLFSGPRRVLIASGGGGNRTTAACFRSEVRRLITDLPRTLLEPFEVIQALGPRASTEDRIVGVDRVFDAGAKLHEAFSRADLVISTVGYNSALELACTDVPVLLVPVARTFDDQDNRAIHWGPRLGLRHSADDPERSVRWMTEILAGRMRRPVVELGLSGATAAAVLIEQLLA